MNQWCIDNQTPPFLQPGDFVDHGIFFRNLKKEHVTKRYGNDDDENPVYGFKLSKNHWKYAEKQGRALSVNLKSCIHTEICSIALHPGGDDYFHVAVLDLEATNRLLPSPLVAQYSPIKETQNRCHFDILPRDDVNFTWMTLRTVMDEPFPVCKVPTSEEENAKAAAAFAQYRSCCDIRRWVRPRDHRPAA